MSRAYRLSCPVPRLRGEVAPEPSKSLSNRALIIRALCKEPFQVHRLSGSDDTRLLEAMLASDSDILYARNAGSSYRFMTALACLGDREITLDASEQLRRRPIGPLVRALQALGADIDYLNKEGFPPLKIRPAKDFGHRTNEVSLQAGISSQYITALLLIAPGLPDGLAIHLSGAPVSASYIHMTLAMMGYFGIGHTWDGNTIRVSPGAYQPREFTVEGDWSAASYFYSMAALAEEAEIAIEGLYPDSLQGDAVVAELYKPLGVETIFNEKGIVLKKNTPAEKITEFVHDFSLCPDIAQTVMVTLAGLGIKGKLSGLRTLRIKETDRIAAMQAELAKIKTVLEVKAEGDDITCRLSGKARWKDKARFDTYGDHRMAMALAPLACISPILIRDPDVVQKSYPGFWEDMGRIGFFVRRET